VLYKMQATNPPAGVKLLAAYNNAVAQGKVLDVSGIREDGTGTRKVEYPRATSGTKKWIGDLPIVSNSYDAYAFAVRTLGVPDAEGYAIAFRDSFGVAPLVRQLAVSRPAPIMPLVVPQGALVVSADQVVVRGTRSPAKRGGRQAPKSPRAAPKKSQRGGKPKAHHVQHHHRVQSPRVAPLPRAPSPVRQVIAAPRLPSPNRQGFVAVRAPSPIRPGFVAAGAVRAPSPVRSGFVVAPLSIRRF
jgi:hypothetical protein